MSQSRQLAAIMFTDIVGYTALMGKDSNKALVEKHHGQWLKEMKEHLQ
jgi:class 3 adenylate cyclase